MGNILLVVAWIVWASCAQQIGIMSGDGKEVDLAIQRRPASIVSSLDAKRLRTKRRTGVRRPLNSLSKLLLVSRPPFIGRPAAWRRSRRSSRSAWSPHLLRDRLARTRSARRCHMCAEAAENEVVDEIARISAERYHAVIEEAIRDNKVVVFKFVATWCKTCRAFGPKVQSLADEYPSVEFYEVLFDDDKRLFKSLGINVLPYIELVSGREGKLPGFATSIKKVPQLETKIASVVASVSG